MAKDDDMELVRGSGNVFADLGLPNPELEQLRASLAAEIGKSLTAEGWGVREAARIRASSCFGVAMPLVDFFWNAWTTQISSPSCRR